MAIIHDDIDSLLAADLHGELSTAEQEDLHTHLVECAACRKLHQENKIMNNVLEESLSAEKPDEAFERRLISRFRRSVPHRAGFAGRLFGFLRWRPIRFAAATCLVLFLVGLGTWLTHPPVWAFLGNEEFARRSRPEQGALADLREQLGDREVRLDRFAEFGNRPLDMPAQQRPDFAQNPPVLELHRDLVAKSAPTESTAGYAADDDKSSRTAQAERVVVAGSNIPTAEEVGPNPETEASPAAGLVNRKLIRNATIDLEVVSFDDTLQKITALTNEARGYIDTTSSEKQSNGKLKGQIIAKVLPENLDQFLQTLRGLGELKNQAIGTEDVTKAYFDTEARLKNSRVMEQRLVEMLKKSTGKVSDLLQVEKELGRVREESEKMQGELKFWDSQVQFATVTISLAEKDLEEPAGFLLREHAQLALYTPEVERVYASIKALASAKVQITNAQLDRDNTGNVSAKISMLIAPEESEKTIESVKTMARVENFKVQTERVAEDGDGMSENAKTKRDKVELNVTISRDEQEKALQQTSLRIRTAAVDHKARLLRALAAKQKGRLRSSSFTRGPNGREFANISVRLPMKNYAGLMQSLNSLGKLEDLSVQRQDRHGQMDDENAPVEVSVQIYSEGSLVSTESGLFATLRTTITQGAAALMWSLRMIAVAVAFLLPWALIIAVALALVRRARRIRGN